MFRHVGMNTKVYTPFACGAFTELFSKDSAVAELEKGTVTFFAGGKEGTVVFHDLHTDAKIVRQMIAYDVAFFQMDALCHPD